MDLVGLFEIMVGGRVGEMRLVMGVGGCSVGIVAPGL